MSNPIKKLLTSGKVQLNAIGLAIMVVAAYAAYRFSHPLTPRSLIPLVLWSYVFLRILYEMTLNRANVPTLATTFVGRRKIAKILKADAAARSKSPYTVIDLGSGRGELTRVIAKAIPNAKVIGIEFAHIPCAQAALIQRLFGPSNLSYLCCDFFPYDCTNVDAAVFYLNPTMARKVGEKLYRELKQGSIVISHTFPLEGDWTPIEILEYRSPFQEKMYIYRKP